MPPQLTGFQFHERNYNFMKALISGKNNNVTIIISYYYRSVVGKTLSTIEGQLL